LNFSRYGCKFCGALGAAAICTDNLSSSNCTFLN
jgi:hypothetical protein